MAYLGREPAIGTFQKLDSIRGFQNGSRQTFAMTISDVPFTPESVYQLMVVKNGLIIEPGVDYSINSTNISFVQAPLANDVIWIMAYAAALFTGQPSDGTVTTQKIADATIDYNKFSGDTVGVIIADALTFGI